MECEAGREVQRVRAMKAGKRIVDPAAMAAVRQAFTEQASEELIRAAHRYARQRAVMVRRAGRRIDSLYAGELVQDALGDTWAGQVRWDPARLPLLDHVRTVIRSRSWKDAQWARRCPHLSLDVNDTSASLAAAASHYGSISLQERPIMISNLTVAIVTELQRLAHGHHAATAILSAWEEGKVDRAEVMKCTGLSAAQYHAARARLTYLVRELPSSLGEAARDYLRRA